VLEDKNQGPATLFLGASVYKVSTSQATYVISNDPMVTGSISSLALGYTGDNISLQSGSLYVSSIYLGGFGGSPAAQLTTDTTATNLYWSTQQLAKASADIVVSTLGNFPFSLFPQDIGRYFLFTENNAGQSLSLPDPPIKGWNAIVKNMEASFENFSVVTSTVNAAVLAPGVATTLLCDGVTYYAL
jgi:hypothetical protein